MFAFRSRVQVSESIDNHRMRFFAVDSAFSNTGKFGVAHRCTAGRASDLPPKRVQVSLFMNVHGFHECAWDVRFGH